jgi:CO/xanthine dehydrogenase FAD-binding subunit
VTLVASEEQAVVIPTSRDDAISAFGDGSGVTVMGGGTILMPELALGRARRERFLLVARAGLDEIRNDDGQLRIGAAVRIAQLLDAPEPLATAAASVGDAEIRAQATIGGNLCAAPGPGFPRGDLQAPLIALGARVRSAGAGGERTEPVEDFLAGEPASRLVLEIELDGASRRGASAAIRRPHAHSYTPLAVAATVAADGSDLRVAVSGAGPHAVRLPSVESSGLDGVPQRALDDVSLADDALASAWYREKMLPVLVARALTQLKERQ